MKSLSSQSPYRQRALKDDVYDVLPSNDDVESEGLLETSSSSSPSSSSSSSSLASSSLPFGSSGGKGVGGGGGGYSRTIGGGRGRGAGDDLLYEYGDISSHQY